MLGTTAKLHGRIARDEDEQAPADVGNQMGPEAGKESRGKTGNAIHTTAPFFNLWCQTDALLHISPAAKE